MQGVFYEIAIIIIIAVIVSAVMKLLKQPLIIGYIITGILASPNIFNLVRSQNAINAFSELGIVLLLFLVGLGLNPKTIKEVGKISVITGVGQVLFTSIFGFLIMKLFGFSTITAVYVAVAITFSSTIIILKLLTDKNDLDTLYGKIAVGFLIIQDLIAMIILIAVSSSSAGGSVGIIIAEALLKGFMLLIFLMLLSMYVVPPVFRWAAKNQEFLLMLSIAWCIAIAALFFSLDFSMEVGALLAGITLAPTIYRHEISSKLKPLRDFFLVIFFILLGSQMTFQSFSIHIIPILVLSAFILIGNPLIVMVLLGLMNFSKRTGFMAGLTVAQISEFSLILLALGVKVGHLSQDILSMVTIIGLITIAGSTYLIKYSSAIYPKISGFLSLFEKKANRESEKKVAQKADVILFGYNRIGHEIFESIKNMKKKYLIVDYNPDTIEMLKKQGIPCRYGDANDTELLNELSLDKAKMVVSTIPDEGTNMLLIKKSNEANEMMITIVISHQIDEALKLYEAGATYVIMPHFLGGRHASMILENFGLRIDKFLSERLFHIENLKTKKELGHEHPINSRN